MTCRAQTCISSLRRRITVRRRNEEGKHRGDEHDSGNDVQRAASGAARLTHIGNKQRAKCTGEASGREHEAVDRSDIFCAEIIGGKGGHGSKSSAGANSFFFPFKYCRSVHRRRTPLTFAMAKDRESQVTRGSVPHRLRGIASARQKYAPPSSRTISN